MPRLSSPAITIETSLNIQAACMPDQIVLLRGSESHLEVLIDSTAEYLEVILELIEKLDGSPPFSQGAETIIRFSEKPIPGMMVDLEKIATMYKLSIISIRSFGDDKKRTLAKTKALSPKLFPESVGANIAAMSERFQQSMGMLPGQANAPKNADRDVASL